MAGFNAHYVAAALAHSKDQLLLDLISKVWKDKQNPGTRHIDSMFVAISFLELALSIIFPFYKISALF